MSKMQHSYTPEEEQFIRDNMSGRRRAELTELFNRRFGLSLTNMAIRKKIITAGYNANSKQMFIPMERNMLTKDM